MGATIGHAIGLWCNRDGADYGTCWPVRVFEGSVDSAEVIGTEEHALRVRGFRVEREVSLIEVFGMRASEVVGLVDTPNRIRWLRPDAGADMKARLDELVAEHYAALAEYGPVRARPLRLLRTWHEARDRHDEVERVSDTETAAFRASCWGNKDVTQSIALQAAQHKVIRSAYFGAWDAAWVESGRSAATGARAAAALGPLAELEEHDRIATATRAAAELVSAHRAAREPARRTGWDLAYELFANLREDIPRPVPTYTAAIAAAQQASRREVPHRPLHSPECAVCRSAPEQHDAIVAGFIAHTCLKVWVAAVGAAQLFSWRAGHLVHDVPRADPGAP